MSLVSWVVSDKQVPQKSRGQDTVNGSMGHTAARLISPIESTLFGSLQLSYQAKIQAFSRL